MGRAFVLLQPPPPSEGPRCLGTALVFHIPGDSGWEDTWLVVSMSSWIPRGTWMSAGPGTSIRTLINIENLFGRADIFDFTAQKFSSALSSCFFWWHQTMLDDLGDLFLPEKCPCLSHQNTQNLGRNKEIKERDLNQNPFTRI